MPTMQSKLVSRTIWLEKKKIWKINIQKNGIRKSFYSSTPGDKGRKICAQNAASWLSGSCPFAVSDHTTVETVFERYLKDKELETTNIYTIRNRYNNHIKPIIGKIPVMLLTKQDLKRVIYTAYRKCDLSQKSLKNIRGDLSGFCNYLDLSDIRNDLRTNNIRIPSTAKKGKKQALDVVSLDILFSESQAPYNGTVCQDSLIYAYRFNVVTGMRTGELMGLEWGDMKAVGIRYVAYFNRRYQRDGPLFRGRYNSQPVTTKGYFLRVLRYIHRNPVAAGIVQEMQDYPWSSYLDYFGSRKKVLCQVDTSYALALHGLEWLRSYHQRPELNTRGMLEDSPLPAFTDGELRDFIRATAGMECHEIPLYPETITTPLLRRLVEQEGAGISQLARLTGLARGDIRRRLL